MSEHSEVQDFIAILEEHRKTCEQTGNYIEADIAKKRLEDLRRHEVSQHRKPWAHWGGGA